MGFLDSVIKDSGNEFAGLVSEGVAAGDITNYVDTGSYIFNALVSGSIYGGLPANKVTALAGESSTGKTFFALSVVRNFLEANPKAGVIYFETESAISKEMIESRGIDSKRMVLFPVATIEEFRTQACRILDKYLKEPKDKREPMMFVLDSLGMLSTSKEMDDIANDKQVRDMTKSQTIKSVFRIITSKLGKLKIPMIVTNHTYKTMNPYGDPTDMGGGSGLKYAASTIITLTKSKEKDSSKEIIGNIIKVKTYKSRLTKENTQIATRLFFDSRGLDEYYGLLELGEKHGIFIRKGNRILVGESSVYPSAILADPLKYFTKEVMQALDEAASKEFKYDQ